jgi:CRP-like cAMP-binding protein
MSFDRSLGQTRPAVSQANRVAFLQRIPFFDGVSKRHLRHIAKLTGVKQFEPGQDLFTEGQPSDLAYVVVAGTAVVRRNGRKINDVAPGDFVGELGLLLDRPRTASVISTAPMQCLTLDRKGLKSAVVEFPELGWRLLTTVADRLSN